MAVLLAEHPADGGRLDGSEHEAGEGDRHQLVQIAPADRGQTKGRQALRHFAKQRHALRIEVHEPGR